MRTMKNFAAQQLSMQQMMQILGGKYQVSVYAADGRFLNRITGRCEQFPRSCRIGAFSLWAGTLCDCRSYSRIVRIKV